MVEELLDHNMFPLTVEGSTSDSGTALLNRNKLDPREHAFRPTITTSYLKGLVTADCFSDGVALSGNQ